MPQLTDRQRNLLALINQLSPNLSPNSAGTSANSSLIDIDLGVNFGRINGGTTPPGNGTTPPPGTPTTVRELLISLLNEQVGLTTPFGTVTGTLINVQNDYVTLIEDSGVQVLVRIDKIEFVSEL
ncbi:DUF2642 domain-containing protein [Oceanobacillus bengalensis]|uniref:DUF2642 domain-containing protein n=1 Tax=Oceanobacillus bengalensis TaxID=1435466 RepID=A0A494Z4U8_9BACI|nr:DUF2642 domain-containing protein [Oceanobacillus bengalensis]RKQ17543.1 DUF2642 domain-containing protein [Oceanobacillus bengalensis]